MIPNSSRHVKAGELRQSHLPRPKEPSTLRHGPSRLLIADDGSDMATPRTAAVPRTTRGTRVQKNGNNKIKTPGSIYSSPRPATTDEHALYDCWQLIRQTIDSLGDSYGMANPHECAQVRETIKQCLAEHLGSALRREFEAAPRRRSWHRGTIGVVMRSTDAADETLVLIVSNSFANEHRSSFIVVPIFDVTENKPADEGEDLFDAQVDRLRTFAADDGMVHTIDPDASRFRPLLAPGHRRVVIDHSTTNRIVDRIMARLSFGVTP